MLGEAVGGCHTQSLPCKSVGRIGVGSFFVPRLTPNDLQKGAKGMIWTMTPSKVHDSRPDLWDAAERFLPTDILGQHRFISKGGRAYAEPLRPVGVATIQPSNRCSDCLSATTTAASKSARRCRGMVSQQ